MLPVRCLLAALAFAAIGTVSPAPAAEAVIVVQRSPLAGFRHYDGRDTWRDMKVGDRLQLVREPDNPYDSNAVRVDWRGVILGYVPRRDNAAVARQMDHGAALEARVAGVRENRNHSVRVEFEVVAPLVIQSH